MPSFLFMKLLESTPERYDRGIEVISHGKIGEVYEEISRKVSGPGKKILDVGCGTGNLSIACAGNGASVTGIDINSGMLDVARRKVREGSLEKEVTLIEMGVAEILSKFGEASFDSCVSCLAFSELTEDEQKYATSAIHSVLKRGGTFLIADEVEPVGFLSRTFRKIANFPSRLIAYILTQSTTRPLLDIIPTISNAGFIEIEAKRLWNDSFIIIQASSNHGEGEE